MARTSRGKVVQWMLVGVAAAGTIAAATWRATLPISIETTHPERKRIVESFEEPARTRLSRTWRIAMPVRGRLGRIEFDAGDAVRRGQALVEFDNVPFVHSVAEEAAAVQALEAEIVVKQDNRVEQTGMTQSEATVTATGEVLKASAAQVDAERVRADRSLKERARMEALAQQKAIPQTSLDDARAAADTAVISLREKEFNQAAMTAMYTGIQLLPKLIQQFIGKKGLEKEVLVHKLAQSRARLAQAEHDLALARVVSPIDGVVLKRYEQGDSTYEAGRPLLLLGNLSDIEAIADVLTSDALKLKEGETVVELQPAADFAPIRGHVKLIQPAGFTKLSSLGVEQQRVNVIISFEGEPTNLGVEYRLQARFFTAYKNDALVLPRFTLMESPDGEHYVFVITDGRLARKSVKTGLQNDTEVEILTGLTTDDVVVLRPEATLGEGMRVTSRGR